MSLNKTIASIVMLSALACGSMWAGDRYNINARIKQQFYSATRTEVSTKFYDSAVETNLVVLKGKDGIEYYLKTPEGNLPMLKGNSGLQLGADRYIINNLDKKSLDDYIINEVGTFSPDFDKQILANMNRHTLENYVVDNLSNFSPDFKKRVVSKYVSDLKDELSKRIIDYSKQIKDFLNDWLNKP